MVALFTRAWIEIQRSQVRRLLSTVALFTRAWIEIVTLMGHVSIEAVALFTRAWIEISLKSGFAKAAKGRPLHEGVD